LVRHARRGGPAPVPDPAPVVTATTPNGPADDGPPKPPRPDDPKPDPEPTPPPPVAPPPPSLPEPDLSEADLTQLTSQVSHASQIAAALNAEAIADLQRDLTLYPKAADQLNVALQLVKLVGRATEDIKGASLHRPSLDGYQGELKGLGEALPKTRLADAVKAEVKGWADLLRAVDGLGKHLAGASGQRPRFSTGAPGVRAGCAKEWDEAVNKALYPALEEFDARNYDAAKKDAERAADRLDPNGPLLVALDAAKALSALCGAARGATSIDAFEQLKGSASVKGSCLALREVKLDLARTEAPQFSRAGWTQSDRGFASVAASLRPLTPRPLHEFFKKDTPGVVVGSSDYISQVRIKMTREKGALELIHVKDRYVFLGTDSSKRFPTKGFARVEADDAAKLEYKGSGVTEVQDFIFVPKSATEVELKVLVNGKEIASEDLATNDAVTLFGGHLVAKEYSVLVKRFPAASK
ncbi:MAG TPA: hypothetical protein VFF73_16485, partial [Planctomycetota bacterium]|nr:hypothetical protein [Planctomycetota bacterium]